VYGYYVGLAFVVGKRELMSVTTWLESYTDHSAWQIIEATLNLIDEAEAQDDPYQTQLDYIRIVLSTIRHWEEMPSLLVSQAMLTALDTAVRNYVKKELDNWQTTNNPNHISNAHANVPQVLDAIRGWPPAKERSIRSAAASLRESVAASDTYLKKLKDSTALVEGELHQVALDLGQRFDEREDLSIKRFQELEQKLSSTAGEIDQMDGRVDTLIAQQQERFEKTAQTRLEKHQESLKTENAQFEEVLNEAVEKSQNTLDAQQNQADETLARLGELKQDAEDVVGAIGTASTANWYQTHAEEQQRSANIWRIVAVALFVGAFGVVAYSVFIAGTSGDTWKSTTLKATATFTLVAGAAYAAKESGRHREAEFGAKKTELTLRALDPFIATLNENERQQLKMDTTRYVFIPDGQPKPASVIRGNDEEVIEPGDE
jgi:flagellar hook-basal body complex protein FliE